MNRDRRRGWLAVALLLGLHLLFWFPHAHVTGTEEQACVVCQVAGNGSILLSPVSPRLAVALPLLEGWLPETEHTGTPSSHDLGPSSPRGPPFSKHS